MADCRFEVLKRNKFLNNLMIKKVRTHRKYTKIKISFIFKFLKFELKFVVEIIVCCQLYDLLQNSIKYILLF